MVQIGLAQAFQFAFLILDLRVQALILSTKLIAVFISIHSSTLADWLPQRNDIVLLNSYRERAYVEQEKRLKYTGILANCVMLDNTVEISTALNTLAGEGMIPTREELAALSPYLTRHIKRFGNYELDLSRVPAPVTDDLTFEIEPPTTPQVVEAKQPVSEQVAIEPPANETGEVL